MMRHRSTSKTRTRRVTAILGTAAVVLGGSLLAGAPAATAAPPQPGKADTSGVVKRVGGATAVRLASPADCQNYHVCLWTGTGYTGWWVAFGGNYAVCEGWRFEGTVWQDNVGSIWNRASGPISVWNRYADGSYNYSKLGWLPSNYSYSNVFSRVMDAWVYDPNNNCTSLNLHAL
jgi:hypothetical protein